MRRLWHDIGTHRLAVAIFLGLWCIILGISVFTWNQFGSGIPDMLDALLLLLPLIAGAFVVGWQTPTLDEATFFARASSGAHAGLLVMVFNWVLFCMVTAFDTWQGGGRLPLLAAGAQVLRQAIFWGLLGVVLGAVGGILAAWLWQPMRRLRQDIHIHRLARACFMVVWVASLASMVFTWNRFGPGMPDVVFYLNVAMAVLAGAVVGWWRTQTADETQFNVGAGEGALGGALVMLFVFLVFMALEASKAWYSGGLAEILRGVGDLPGFAIFFVLLGALFGLGGWFVGALLAYNLYRRRSRGGPTAPTGVS